MLKLTNFVGHGIVAIILATVSTPVLGASISLIPSFSQLDGDLIEDIGVKVAETISFNLVLDTTGLTAPLQSFDYFLEIDGLELEFAGSTRFDADIFPNLGFIPTQGDINSITVTRDGDPGLAPNNVVELLSFNYLVLPELENDGLADFSISVVSAIDANGTEVRNLFTPASQSFEVQGVREPWSVLGTGGAWFLGVFLKMKNSLKRQKSKTLVHPTSK